MCFVLSGLPLKSLICVELIFVCGVGELCSFILSQGAVSPKPFIEEAFKLAARAHAGRRPGSPSPPLVCVSALLPAPHCFDYRRFAV